jgi:cytochrome b6-f complex iron-sulfur subunit
VNNRQQNITRRSALSKFGRAIKLFSFAALLLPAERFLSFVIPQRPKLVKVSKTLKKGGFIIETDFIIFDTDTKPIAVSRKCTHLGCTLNYHEIEKMLICPCHKSKFDIFGKRLDGPARQDLDTFAISETGEGKTRGYIVSIIG